MVKVLIKTKGATLRDKILNVTRKCMELSEQFDSFGWDFSRYRGRDICFTAWHAEKDEDGNITEDGFRFPISCVSIEKRYPEIMRELDELKWSAIYWKKEEHE